MNEVGVFCWAGALSFSISPTPSGQASSSALLCPRSPYPRRGDWLVVGGGGQASSRALFCPRSPSSFSVDQRVSGQSGRGAYGTVKRCAVGKASRLIRRGIDPGFIYMEGGNPLLEVGMVWDSSESWNRRGAALIRRRLCGGDRQGPKVQSGDQFSTQSFGRSPLAPGGRGVKARPSDTKLTIPPGRVPLPLEGGGWEGVDWPSVPSRLTTLTKLSPTARQFSS